MNIFGLEFKNKKDIFENVRMKKLFLFLLF